MFISAVNSYVTGSGWALQCTCYGIYTHNTVLARVLCGLIIMSAFISVIKRKIRALVGRYSAHATASIRAILSLPEPTPYTNPPCSLYRISARYAATALWRPDMRGERLQDFPLHMPVAVWHGPVPAHCVYMYPLCTNSIVLQALQERYNAYHCPLADLYLQCPIYVLALKQ